MWENDGWNVDEMNDGCEKENILYYQKLQGGPNLFQPTSSFVIFI